MKTVQAILLQLLAVFSGALMSSLLITHSNSWKFYLPMSILIIVIKMGLHDYERYYKK